MRIDPWQRQLVIRALKEAAERKRKERRGGEHLQSYVTIGLDVSALEAMAEALIDGEALEP